MPEQRKMISVNELARYRVGDVAWWVISRQKKPTKVISQEDIWMLKHHPKALYKRGPYKKLWPSKAALPKLQHIDFAGMMNILTSKLITERFIICDIIRSRDTGEFFYSNDDDEWMPETMLLNTEVEAKKEKRRIIKMLSQWIVNNS